ncbi:MAG: precorrin-3B C(17)-methyltransferase [Frankiaceae bacterium]
MIGLVAATAAGCRHAAHLAAAWPDAKRYDGGAAALREAWAECDGVVAFLAVGAAVRLVAPLLADKRTDPGLVCVDEAARYAVAVTGGHAGGANELAGRVAAALGAEPVVTTASDAAGSTALDAIGWPVEGDVAAVGRALLDGEPVALVADATWPLPPLPLVAAGDPAAACAVARVVVTDAARYEAAGPVALVRPPSLVVGLGASRGAPAGEVERLVDGALAAAGLAPGSVACAATVEAKAGEQGLVEACAARGWPLVARPAAALAGVEVPHPSEVVRAAVGTPSVAEAAALDVAGPGALLVVPKTASAMATVAVARRRPRGRLAVVGLGPGARDLLTPRAAAELARAAHVVGLDQYVDQVRDLLRPGTTVHASGLGDEEARARAAVGLAAAGHAVALIGSGDAGVYAMASPALERYDGGFEVVGVPGVTAALAAAALLGAPLGHDHCAISLSDLHTPWHVIERRVRAAAEGDFVVTLYNPRSRARGWQLGAALDVLRAHRPDGTPVGIVRDASRPGQRVAVTTLGALGPDQLAEVDMLTVVVVGGSQTRLAGGLMVTPRGYRWA